VSPGTPSWPFSVPGLLFDGLFLGRRWPARLYRVLIPSFAAFFFAWYIAALTNLAVQFRTAFSRKGGVERYSAAAAKVSSFPAALRSVQVRSLREKETRRQSRPCQYFRLEVAHCVPSSTPPPPFASMGNWVAGVVTLHRRRNFVIARCLISLLPLTESVFASSAPLSGV